MMKSTRVLRGLIRAAGMTAASGMLVLACFGGGGGGGFGGDGGAGGEEPEPEPEPVPQGAEADLNTGIILPTGSYTVNNIQFDDTVTVSSPPSPPVDAHPGDTLSVAIPFDSQMGNVVAAGIRFGDSGPVNVVPIAGAQGNQQGTLTFQMQIPDDICDNLSSICHDIKCYEFAVTDQGTFSRENIQALALACNDCTEPSCQSLLQECSNVTQCDDTTNAGSDAPYSAPVELGASSGSITLSFDHGGSIPDRTTVVYEGATIIDTGCVADSAGSLTASYSGSSTQVTVSVEPNCDGTTSGTSWSFSLSCPTP